MSTLNRLIEMDHEIGKASSPPKLIKISDYFTWKERFESFARFHDMRMWICIDQGYIPPQRDIEGKVKIPQYVQMTDEEKKLYEAENRALSCIKMCLPHEILHTFSNYRSSKELWDTLQSRYAGNAQVNKSRTDLLKKQFAVFKHLKTESLEDTITRYYHLMTELNNHHVAYSDADKIERFLDALPPKWELYILMMKGDEEKFAELSLEDVIGRLRAYDFHLRKKDLDYNQVQDPGSYRGNPSKATTTGSVSAFLSGTSEDVNILSSEESWFTSTSSGDTGKGKSSQGHQGMSMNVKSAEEQLSVLAAFTASYENYIKGKITDPAMLDEDYDQVDPDDLEEMDLQWQLAMISRRVKRFMNRTGRKIETGKTGFDKSKVRCYNCQGYGHFARECQRPKTESTNASGGRQGYFKPTESQTAEKKLSSKALVVHRVDGSYD